MYTIDQKTKLYVNKIQIEDLLNMWKNTSIYNGNYFNFKKTRQP